MSGGWSYSWGSSAAPKPKPDLVGRNVSKMAPQSKTSLKQPKPQRNSLLRFYSTHFPYREKHCNKKNSTQSREYPKPPWTWPISTIFPQRITQFSIDSRSGCTDELGRQSLQGCSPQTKSAITNSADEKSAITNSADETSVRCRDRRLPPPSQPFSPAHVLKSVFSAL